MCRADLNYIFATCWAKSPRNTFTSTGGDRPESETVSVGLLGADYTIDRDRYASPKVYFGEQLESRSSAPLTEPGVNVHQGD